MKFVIRDDDTCAVTTPRELIECYGEIWTQSPVSLSVIPFRIPGAYRFIPKEFYGSNEPLALATNADLVGFLKEGVAAGRLDIAIHGYHHAVYDGVPEYVSGQDLTRKTLHAKLYLSGLLGLPVRSFVPPHNSLGKEGFHAVIEAGLNLVHVPSLWSTKVRGPSMLAWLNMPRVYWHRRVRNRAYPHVLDFGNHGEIGYHTVGPGSDRRSLLEELDYCLDHDGVFVLATHYHAFDLRTRSGETVRATVYDLVNRAAARPGVNFVGINRIW